MTFWKSLPLNYGAGSMVLLQSDPPGLQRVLELEERTCLSRQAGGSSFCQSRSWVSSSCTDAPSKQTQAPLAGLHSLGVKIG